MTVTPIRRLSRTAQTLAAAPVNSIDAPDPSAFFDERGWLVPAKTEVPNNVQMLRGRTALADEIALADELRAEAFAENTRRSYGAHARGFIDWCAKHGRVALPATPDTVADHLSQYGVRVDADGVPDRDDNGNLQQGRAAASVGIRAAAISKLHAYAELPDPCASVRVRNVLAGFARSFGVAPVDHRAPIVHADLTRCIDAALAPTYREHRDTVIMHLRRHGLSGAQMAALDWADIDVRRDRVRVLLPGDGRSGPSKVILHARPAHPDLCPLVAFTRLRGKHPLMTLEALLVGVPEPHRRLQRQAVMNVVTAHAASSFAGLPSADESTFHAALSAAAHCDLLLRLRDAAVLATGWWTGQRRSNLEILQWGDLLFSGETIQVRITRSKTDQEGRGRVITLKAGGEGVADPVTYLHMWRRAVTQALGVDPVKAFPRAAVFAAVTSGGTLSLDERGAPTGIKGKRINQIVQEHAAAAGLEPAVFNDSRRRRGMFGAHSLRHGFVTEASRDGALTAAQTMAVTGHRSLDSMYRYMQEVYNESNAPSAALAAKLSREHEATRQRATADLGTTLGRGEEG